MACSRKISWGIGAARFRFKPESRGPDTSRDLARICKSLLISGTITVRIRQWNFNMVFKRLIPRVWDFKMVWMWCCFNSKYDEVFTKQFGIYHFFLFDLKVREKTFLIILMKSPVLILDKIVWQQTVFCYFVFCYFVLTQCVCANDRTNKRSRFSVSWSHVTFLWNYGIKFWLELNCLILFHSI